MKTVTMLMRTEKRKTGLLGAVLCIIICSPLFFSAGCANLNVGYAFPADQVKNIQIGKTNKEEN
jgi:hypothetical protein